MSETSAAQKAMAKNGNLSLQEKLIMSETSAAVCPYVGLMPFNESDAEYFFGRENDTEVVATNLRAARLTIFYGASGVGKSSVIRAGVVPHLQKLTTISTLPDEPPDFLLVVLRDWANNPVESLRLRVKETVEKAVADKRIPQLTQDAVRKTALLNQNNDNLTEMLKNWTELIGTKLLIILDQFEDFFLHPEFGGGAGAFGEEFPKAVNENNLPVNFMLSMRDDAIAKLDFFKGKIQDPMNNTLRLRHLDRALAEQAIRNPLKKYNEQMNTAFTIEDALVSQVLDDVQVGKIKFGTQGQANVKQFDSPSSSEPTTASSSQIETPYLQLVMMRLWKDENTQREKCLKKDTLVSEQKLGGVQKIVETHLDEVMSRFDTTDQELAAEFIHFTVTRSGAKITSDAAGLAEWAKLPERRKDIDRILTTLSTGDTRIYKIVVNLRDSGTNYYEVAHDALAPAILNWRSRYTTERNRLAARNSVIKIGLKLSPIIAGLILLALAFGVFQMFSADQSAVTANTAQNAANTAQNAEQKAILATEKQAQERLDAQKAKENLEKLIIALSGLTDESTKNNDEALTQIKQLNEKGGIPEDLKPKLLELTTRIGGKDSEKVSKVLKETPVQTPTPNTNADDVLPPRVYIQILNEQQRPSAKNIQKLLEFNKDEKFLVPGIEYRSDVRLEGTQIRYFRQEDRDEARQILTILESQGIKNVSTQPFISYGKSNSMRPKHLELWLAADAFDGKTSPLQAK